MYKLDCYRPATCCENGDCWMLDESTEETPCWGRVEVCDSYDVGDEGEMFVHACQGHADMSSGGEYIKKVSDFERVQKDMSVINKINEALAVNCKTALVSPSRVFLGREEREQLKYCVPNTMVNFNNVSSRDNKIFGLQIIPVDLENYCFVA